MHLPLREWSSDSLQTGGNLLAQRPANFLCCAFGFGITTSRVLCLHMHRLPDIAFSKSRAAPHEKRPSDRARGQGERVTWGAGSNTTDLQTYCRPDRSFVG